MKVLNKKENENKLFSRKEIEMIVENEVVPSHAEVRELITKEFKTDEGLIRVKKIAGKFGTKEFTITADIYDSKEEFDRIVKKTKHEIEKEKKAAEEKKKAEEEARKAEEEAKAAEEAAKAEAEKPKEEAPVEEPKEEAPAEEKKEEAKE